MVSKARYIRSPWFGFANQFTPIWGSCQGGVVRRETNSWRWPVFMVVYMTGLAYGAALLVYQIGTALGLGGA